MNKYFPRTEYLKTLHHVSGYLKRELSFTAIKACASNGFFTSKTVQKNKIYSGSTITAPHYYLTTPIFYVNANPHLGHLYTVVLADALTRWRKISGYKVTFSTGTDEHGLKIQQAAARSSGDPIDLCNQVSYNFKYMFNEAGVEYTDFIRTTEARHHKAVSQFWRTLKENGHIFKGTYEGWYSVIDEEFLTEDETEEQQLPNEKVIKVSKSSKNPVRWIKEDNYVFKLTSFKNDLHRWLDKKVIHPLNFEPMVRNWVDNLADLSVSRQRDRVTWGIPVPDDESQTIYVWLDALVNYLTVAGYPDKTHPWPPNCQVVGKDILRFHAIYWPAFLMGAGLEPPHQLLCHSHWLVDGIKMSKSRGNVIDPLDQMHKYSVDGFRYSILKEGVPHSDGNYTDRKAVECINADLVNTFGNLLSRCTAESVNPKQIFPPFSKEVLLTNFTESDQLTFAQMRYMADTVGVHYRNYRVYRAIESILYELYWANSIMQDHRPWELRKNSKDEEYLQTVLHVAMETLRISSIMLQPVIPTLASTVLDRLGIPSDKRTVQDSLIPYLAEKESAPLGPSKGILLKRLMY